MMSKESMQQALDALETKGEHHRRVYAAIEPLRQALAQPEPQVCCGDYEKCMKPCTPRGRWLAEKELAEPEQEPAEWYWYDLYKAKCQEFDDKQAILGAEIAALEEELEELKKEQLAKPEEPVWMRMPKVGDRVVCIDDESLGTVAYLTAGGSPQINFDDGSRGTYLLHNFAEFFSYADTALAQPEEPEPLEYSNAVEGWVKVDEIREHFDSVGCGTIYKYSGEGRKPLYAASPRKPWVGLTDAERNEMIDRIQHDQFTRQRDLIGSTQIITEMYLKERNT